MDLRGIVNRTKPNQKSAFIHRFQNCSFMLGFTFPLSPGNILPLFSCLKLKLTHNLLVNLNDLCKTKWNLFCDQLLKLRFLNVPLWSIDCVRLVKVLGEFDYVWLPNPIEDNRTIGVCLIGSITQRSIEYAGIYHKRIWCLDQMRRFSKRCIKTDDSRRLEKIAVKVTTNSRRSQFQ